MYETFNTLPLKSEHRYTRLETRGPTTTEALPLEAVRTPPISQEDCRIDTVGHSPRASFTATSYTHTKGNERTWSTWLLDRADTTVDHIDDWVQPWMSSLLARTALGSSFVLVGIVGIALPGVPATILLPVGTGMLIGYGPKRTWVFVKSASYQFAKMSGFVSRPSIA